MVAIKDTLLDILKFTNSESFDVLKIADTDDGCVVSAVDDDNSIILNAKLKDKPEEFFGTAGMNSLPYLRGILQLESFRGAGSSVTVSTKDARGEEILDAFIFTGSNGAAATYRLMHESAIKPVPWYSASDEWDIEITPTKEKVDEFAQLATLLADVEEQMVIQIEDGDMIFYIGEQTSSSNRAQMTFATDVEGDFGGTMKWPIKKLIYALRLSLTGESSVKLNKKGVMCVAVDSGLVDYNFYVIANQK